VLVRADDARIDRHMVQHQRVGAHPFIQGEVLAGMSRIDGRDLRFDALAIATRMLLVVNVIGVEHGQRHRGVGATNKGVPVSALAVGVHPYHYNTSDYNYWRNYYTEYGYSNTNTFNQPAGPCGDLGLMLNTWLNSLSGEPVIFTEDNWTSNGAVTPDCSQDDGCDGTYLVDLFTWLKDHGYTNSGSSPIRVMWYRGADDGSGGHTLGIYTPNGVGKQIYLNACTNNAINNIESSIDNDYYYLRNGACY
jgi:hypothetical protein